MFTGPPRTAVNPAYLCPSEYQNVEMKRLPKAEQFASFFASSLLTDWQHRCHYVRGLPEHVQAVAATSL